jgi:peptide/nickel transport system substrate-binding protein
MVLLLVLAACGGGATEGETKVATTTARREAPMLAAKVEAGELPPLEERVPVEPLDIDLPWAAVGWYSSVLMRPALRRLSRNRIGGLIRRDR